MRTNKEVALSGTGSFDPDGSKLTFNWELVKAPEGSQLGELAQNPGVTEYAGFNFIPDVDGEYQVRLVVSDGRDKSAPATITLQSSHCPNGTAL